MAIGRSQKYSNNEAGLEKFISLSDAYMNLVKEQGIVPSVSEWCEIMGITKMTLLRYESNRPLYGRVIGAYKEQIREERIKAYNTTFCKLSQEKKKEFSEGSVSA